MFGTRKDDKTFVLEDGKKPRQVHYDREVQQAGIDRMKGLFVGGRLLAAQPVSKHAAGRVGKYVGQRRKK